MYACVCSSRSALSGSISMGFKWSNLYIYIHLWAGFAMVCHLRDEDF